MKNETEIISDLISDEKMLQLALEQNIRPDKSASKNAHFFLEKMQRKALSDSNLFRSSSFLEQASPAFRKQQVNKKIVEGPFYRDKLIKSEIKDAKIKEPAETETAATTPYFNQTTTSLHQSVHTTDSSTNTINESNLNHLYCLLKI